MANKYLPKGKELKVKEIGLWTSVITFFLSLILFYSFDKTDSQFQFVESYKFTNGKD